MGNGIKWYNICPYFRDKEGIAKTHCLFWAQSIFSDVDYHLKEHSSGIGIPNDMSSGLKELFHENLDEELDGWLKKITWREYYRQTLYYANFANAVVPKIRKDRPYKYEGYVSKENTDSFQQRMGNPV